MNLPLVQSENTRAMDFSYTNLIGTIGNVTTQIIGAVKGSGGASSDIVRQDVTPDTPTGIAGWLAGGGFLLLLAAAAVIWFIYYRK